jgi:hypothetical protein
MSSLTDEDKLEPCDDVSITFADSEPVCIERPWWVAICCSIILLALGMFVGLLLLTIFSPT